MSDNHRNYIGSTITSLDLDPTEIFSNAPLTPDKDESIRSDRSTSSFKLSNSVQTRNSLLFKKRIKKSPRPKLWRPSDDFWDYGGWLHSCFGEILQVEE